MSLRKLTKDDLPLVLTWRNNLLEVNRSIYNNHIYNNHEMSEDDYLARFVYMEHDPQTRWYIHQDKNGNADGIVYFTHYYPENRSSFWGFYTAPDAPAGTGAKLGLEALDEAFNALKLHKLNAEVLSTNERSLRFHDKLGFHREGTFRDFYFDGQKYVDVVRFGILNSEWQEKRFEIESRIVKIDVISEKAVKMSARFRIMILSDKTSCIIPYIDDLVEEWQTAGHECFVAYTVDDAIPADFCFCLSFGELISADVRNQYRHTLVVHESSLPKGRGWSPMSWQILEGKNNIPITLFEAVDKVDAGKIYLQEWIKLEGTELASKWRILQAEATLRLCRKFISGYPNILNKAQSQKGEPTFYPRRRPEDSLLDPDKTLAEQFNLLRIVDNERYPAYFNLNGDAFILNIKSKKTKES